MKKLIYIFFFTYSFSCSGQYSELKSTLNQVLIEIDTLQKRIDSAEKRIKDFRNVSNKWADSIKISTDAYKSRFKALEDRLAIDKDSLSLKEFDEELIKVYFPDTVIINPPHSIEQSVEIIKLLKKRYGVVYEPLAFEVSFHQELDKIKAMISAIKEIDSLPESVQDNALERLFNAVDNQAKSVGKRMGRMIQHSITESDYYVTNTSLTRLNMAMTGYLIAKQNLELEIYSIIQISNQKQPIINLECNCSDSIIQPKPRLQFDTGMFFPIIMADTRQSLGFGMVYTISAFTTGGGIMYTRKDPEEQESLVFNLFVGSGIHNFRYGIGGLYFEGSNIFHTSVHLGWADYITKDLKKAYAGIAISQNRVMINIGLPLN